MAFRTRSRWGTSTGGSDPNAQEDRSICTVSGQPALYQSGRTTDYLHGMGSLGYRVADFYNGYTGGVGSAAVGHGRVAYGDSSDDTNGYYSGSVWIFTTNSENSDNATYYTPGSGVSITASNGTKSGWLKQLQGHADSEFLGCDVNIGNNKIIVGAYGYNNSRGRTYLYDLNGENEQVLETGTLDTQRCGEFVFAGDGRYIVSSLGGGSQVPLSKLRIYDEDGVLVKTMNATDYSSAQGGLRQWAVGYYGRGFTLHDNILLVGARQLNSDGTYSSTGSGRVEVYTKNGDFQGLITCPAGDDSDEGFGSSLAVKEGRIVIGAPFASTVQGTNDRGKAYVFDYAGNLIATLEAPNPNDSYYSSNLRFGSTVEIDSGKIFVSEPFWDAGAFVTSVGKIHVFDLDGNRIGELQQQIVDGGEYLGGGVISASNGVLVEAGLGSHRTIWRYPHTQHYMARRSEMKYGRTGS